MDILQSPHRYRYVDFEKYCLALKSFLHGKRRSDYFVILVSDGYDRLIQRLTQSTEVKLCSSIADLAEYFTSELSDLAKLADIYIIGESENSCWKQSLLS